MTTFWKVSFISPFSKLLTSLSNSTNNLPSDSNAKVTFLLSSVSVCFDQTQRGENNKLGAIKPVSWLYNLLRFSVSNAPSLFAFRSSALKVLRSFDLGTKLSQNLIKGSVSPKRGVWRDRKNIFKQNFGGVSNRAREIWKTTITNNKQVFPVGFFRLCFVIKWYNY